VGADDDDGRQISGSIIRGGKLKFSNEAVWLVHDEEVPPEREHIMVDVLRVVQKWVDQLPVEVRILDPGEKVPNVKALNDACPKSEWRKDFNGNLVGPWQFSYVVYLITTESLDKFTFPTGTAAGSVAVNEIVDKVKMMRGLRGLHVCPVVTLSDTFFPTRFGGRQRPHFDVQRWVQIGGDTPALPAPHPISTMEALAEPAKTELLPGIKTVTEPTLSEQMGDEIPFNDSPDPNVPVAKMEPKVTPPHKPAAQSQMTKKGVQKLAGSRGR
jgi:hypothetical protein